MKDIDWSRVPESGLLVLMTAEDVEAGAVMKMADFRDTHALFYSRFGRWLGLSRRGVRLGTSPLRLVDGIWYAAEDRELSDANPDHAPDVSQISLKVIG